MALTPEQQSLSDNQNIPAGQVGSPWVTPNGQASPQSPVILQPNQISGGTTLNLPQPDLSTNGADGLVAGANMASNGLQDTITQLTPAVTPLDTQNQGLLNDIATLTGQEGNKSQDLLNAQNQAGVPQQQKDLTDINNQIRTASAQYEKMFQNADVGIGQTSNDVTGQQGAIRRSQAADIGLLTARAQAIQGNLTLALDTASKSIDAKYSSLESQIAAKKAQLDAIAPQLNKQQATQALAQKTLLDKQAQDLADKKAAQKDNINLALQAGIATKFINKNGQFFSAADGTPYATPEEFFKAAGVSSFQEAYQKGLVTDFGNQQIGDLQFGQEAQAKYPDAGIKAGDSPEVVAQKVSGSKIYQNSVRLLKGSGGGGGGGGTTTTTGQTTGVVDQDAQAVLEGRNTLYNIRQTMGRSNSAAAYMQSLRSAITKVDPQFDFVASDAGGKAVSTTYYQKAISSINSVLPNIDKIIDLSNQVNRIGVKGVDALLQKGQTEIGNQKVSNFRQAQKLIADEIGVALGAGTVSDMKLQLGFDVTDPSVSPEVFASNMQIVKEFINNRKQGLNDLRYQSSTTSTGVNSPPPQADLTGQLVVQDKSGKQFTIPPNQLKDAVAQGYVVVKKL